MYILLYYNEHRLSVHSPQSDLVALKEESKVWLLY